jgi:hypothetical protein
MKAFRPTIDFDKGAVKVSADPASAFKLPLYQSPPCHPIPTE